MIGRGIAGALISILMAAASSAAVPEELAPGVFFLRGVFVEGRQPDGNSVLFQAPGGFVVVDTGRHREHTQALIDFAAGRKMPLAAVVNTHWHLDHIGGNVLLRREVPGIRIWASSALADAQKGFLARYRGQLEQMISRSANDPAQQQQFRTEMALIDAGEALAPDETVEASGSMRLAGRELDLRLETHAATAGDIVVFDRASRVLVTGDLITLPAPFLDTACPNRWRDALDRLARTDFELVIPGHGPPMGPEAFEHYRTAFGNLLDCAATDRTVEACSDGWLETLGSLIPEKDHAFTRQMLDYYIENHLRGDPAATAALCGERS